MARKHVIILQFQSTNMAEEIGWLHEFEQVLFDAFTRNGSGVVDGHDIGSGTMNIYIHAPAVNRALEIIMAHLKHRNIADKAVIAKRDKNDRYDVLWPRGYSQPFREM